MGTSAELFATSKGTVGREAAGLSSSLARLEGGLSARRHLLSTSNTGSYFSPRPYDSPKRRAPQRARKAVPGMQHNHTSEVHEEWLLDEACGKGSEGSKETTQFRHRPTYFDQCLAADREALKVGRLELPPPDRYRDFSTMGLVVLDRRYGAEPARSFCGVKTSEMMNCAQYARPGADPRRRLRTPLNLRRMLAAILPKDGSVSLPEEVLENILYHAECLEGRPEPVPSGSKMQSQTAPPPAQQAVLPVLLPPAALVEGRCESPTAPAAKKRDESLSPVSPVQGVPTPSRRLLKATPHVAPLTEGSTDHPMTPLADWI